MEEATPAEVGSLLSSVETTDAGFERIADEVAALFPEARTSIVTSDTIWSPARAAEFVAQMEAEGGKGLTVKVDLTDPDAIGAARDEKLHRSNVARIGGTPEGG